MSESCQTSERQLPSAHSADEEKTQRNFNCSSLAVCRWEILLHTLNLLGQASCWNFLELMLAFANGCLYINHRVIPDERGFLHFRKNTANMALEMTSKHACWPNKNGLRHQSFRCKINDTKWVPSEMSEKPTLPSQYGLIRYVQSIDRFGSTISIPNRLAHGAKCSWLLCNDWAHGPVCRFCIINNYCTLSVPTNNEQHTKRGSQINRLKRTLYTCCATPRARHPFPSDANTTKYLPNSLWQAQSNRIDARSHEFHQRIYHFSTMPRLDECWLFGRNEDVCFSGSSRSRYNLWDKAFLLSNISCNRNERDRLNISLRAQWTW